MKPVLVVAVRHGGELFRRCVDSICACGPVFERVIVSVNGLSPAEDEAAAAAIGRCGLPLEILRTKKDLSSVQHATWVVQQLQKRFEPWQRLLFLAHDDELIAHAMPAWLSEADHADRATAWIGDFEVCAEGRLWRESSLPMIDPAASLTPDQWLRHNAATERGFVFTNVSGMSVTLNVFRDLTRFWRFTGGRKGVRCEYMLLTHREIAAIRRNTDPIVRIHEHPQQEGKRVAAHDFESDELRYRVWMLINAPTARSLMYRLSQPATPRSLWRHFRRSIMSRWRARPTQGV